MKIGKRTFKFPLFFLIGLGLIVTALILRGKDLMISVGWRFLAGIGVGIAVLIVLAIFKKKKRSGLIKK